MTAATFVDAEEVLIDYLTTQIAPTPVVSLVPATRPAEFVRIERIGGSRETRVTEEARFIIEAWSATDAEAVALLNLVRHHIHDSEGQMFGVDEYAGPSRLPDPDSNMRRYTASFAIRVRAIP